jgi:hypothetical protein
MGLAHAGRADQEHISVLTDEAAGSELVDLPAIDRGVEAEVEVLDSASVAEASGVDATRDGAIGANRELVGDNGLEELGVVVGPLVAERLSVSEKVELVEAVREECGVPAATEALSLMSPVTSSESTRGRIKALYH